MFVGVLRDLFVDCGQGRAYIAINFAKLCGPLRRKYLNSAVFCGKQIIMPYTCIRRVYKKLKVDPSVHMDYVHSCIDYAP